MTDQHAEPVTAEEIWRLLEALVKKLRECERPIADAFMLAAIHGGSYSGPNYKAELEAAESALKEGGGRG